MRPNRGGDGTKADVVDRAAAAARVTKADRRIILLLLSESGMFCCLIFVREQVLIRQLGRCELRTGVRDFLVDVPPACPSS